MRLAKWRVIEVTSEIEELGKFEDLSQTRFHQLCVTTLKSYPEDKAHALFVKHLLRELNALGEENKKTEIAKFILCVHLFLSTKTHSKELQGLIRPIADYIQTSSSPNLTEFPALTTAKVNEYVRLREYCDAIKKHAPWARAEINLPGEVEKATTPQLKLAFEEVLKDYRANYPEKRPEVITLLTQKIAACETVEAIKELVLSTYAFLKTCTHSTHLLKDIEPFAFYCSDMPLGRTGLSMKQMIQKHIANTDANPKPASISLDEIAIYGFNISKDRFDESIITDLQSKNKPSATIMTEIGNAFSALGDTYRSSGLLVPGGSYI